MSYSFQKAHSYLINSLQIREKVFTETKIQSSFLGIRLKLQTKDDKSALPRSSEANSAGLGRVAHEDTSPENSIKTRLSIEFCSDIRPQEGCSQLLISYSIYQSENRVGRSLFWLEGWGPTSTFTVLCIKYLATQSIILLCPESSVFLSFPFQGTTEVWEQIE